MAVKVKAQGMQKRALRTLLLLLAIAAVLSIPSAVRLFMISEIYTSGEVRDGVYDSTMYLQSQHGILLSSIKLADVRVDGRTLISAYSFRYPSHVKRCDEKILTVFYSLDKKKIIGYTIPYYENATTIC